MPNETMINKRANGINWNTTVFMVLFHFGAVAALFLFSWRGVAAAIVLWWVAGSLGVGIGFRRLLTHRGYKTPKLVEYFLTVCGTLALEGGAINWVVTHRIHHAHADAPGDPHTPRDGRWWSHMGWILRGTAQQYDGATVARYAPDMLKDAFQVWLNRLYWVPLVLRGFWALIHVRKPKSTRKRFMIREGDMTILVVEDVAETRDGIEKLLKADGYHVVVARDEHDAIESAQLRHPDLILVSLAGLPNEVIVSARRIREHAEVGEKVPVVLFCIEGI